MRKALEGKEIFFELVKRADVVVENLTPGAMENLGLGFTVLRELNPAMIYATVKGFGELLGYGQEELRRLEEE